MSCTSWCADSAFSHDSHTRTVKNKPSRGMVHCCLFPKDFETSRKRPGIWGGLFHVFFPFPFQQSPFYQLLHAGWPVSTAAKFCGLVFPLHGQLSFPLSKLLGSEICSANVSFSFIQRKPGAPGPPGHPGKAGVPVSVATSGLLLPSHGQFEFMSQPLSNPGLPKNQL